MPESSSESRATATQTDAPPDGLRRRRVTLDDNRYIYFYTSGDPAPAADGSIAGKPEAAPAPAPVDAQPVADDQTEEER